MSASAIAETPATAGDKSDEEDVFILAQQIEKILSGKSNRTCMKVLNMVGSLHGIRAIRSDRPIGPSLVGTTKVVPVKAAEKKKGRQSQPAAWKQTESYRTLSAERDEVVSNLKSTPAGADKSQLVERLRTVELSLKGLKSPQAGN